MKLLIVCPDWFPFSAGLAQSCLEFCLQAKKASHKIRVITAKDEGLQNKGLDVVGLPYAFRLGGKSPIVFNYWKKIKPHIEWADKIILYSYMFEMNTRIVLFRKFGLFNKPIIHMYRGSLENDVLRNVSFSIKLMKWTWDVTLGRCMFTGVDKTISNSKPTLQVIQKRFAVNKKKLAYVPSGFNIYKYKKSSQRFKRVVFIGRLVENKGVFLFEEIVKSLPFGWEFTILGSGPLENYVHSLEKKYSQIKFRGKVSEDEMIEVLTDSSVLALPSYAEGSPRVVIEALASGVVPVSFAVGDIPNILKQSKEVGFSITLADTTSFCNKLTLLTMNAKLRKRFAEKAYLEAKKYSWKKIYPKLEKDILS